jgi:Fe-S cluster assembly ATP-binding protein
MFSKTNFYKEGLINHNMVEKLQIENISCNINGSQILKDISFEVESGKVVVLMGPNGAGKSTISNILTGNPKYELTSGKITLNGEDITDLPVNEKAKRGLFMSFQNPVEISGVTMTNFLRTSYNSLNNTNIQLAQFMKLLKSNMEELGLDAKFRGRFVNSGFSGGEKKRAELLQLMLFEPKYVILDEIDSGLDVDGIKLVSEMLNKILEKRKIGVLIITHYNKILEYIKPDSVVVLKSGEISQIGGIEVAHKILESGFNK